MILCGFDVETTGLEIGVISVVECGLVLWDTELHSPVKVAGYLVDPGSEAIWEPGVIEKHNITPEMCFKYGTSELAALKQVLSWVHLADAVVAHNGTAFDYPVLQHWAKKHNLDWESGKTWIDTNCDLYPNQRPTTLTHLAADHGFLNPFSHRASFDVVTMLKILDCYNIPHILEVAKSPTLTIQAIVDYANNDKARALHYRAEYKNEKFQYWGKTIRACYLEQEREAARLIGFDIEIIKTKV